MILCGSDAYERNGSFNFSRSQAQAVIAVTQLALTVLSPGIYLAFLYGDNLIYCGNDPSICDRNTPCSSPDKSKKFTVSTESYVPDSAMLWDSPAATVAKGT